MSKEIPVRVKVYVNRLRRSGKEYKRFFLVLPKEFEPVIGDKKEIMIKIVLE